MFAEIAATAVVCFAGGVVVGKKYEQKVVAKVLAEFAAVDDEARMMVNRSYAFVTGGVKAELGKLLKR